MYPKTIHTTCTRTRTSLTIAVLILSAALPNLGFANDRTETQQRAVLWIIEALAHIDNREGWYMHPERPIETIDHDTVERRYSKKMVEQKIYAKKKVTKTVPIKDSEGTITGYEERSVSVNTDKVTGTKKVEKLVSDPKGSIVRQVKVPIRGPSRNFALPDGFLGTNAMALACLNQAGLGKRPESLKLARALARTISQTGAPDNSFDLCWLAIGLGTSPGEEFEKTYLAILDRLLNSQVTGRKATGAGLWGPVLLQPELIRALEAAVDKARGEHKKMMEQYTAAPSSRRKAIEKQMKPISELVGQLSHEMAWATRTGQRYASATKDFSLNNRKLNGAAYNFYAHQFSSIHDTALVARTLLTLQQAEKLPRGSRRLKYPGVTGLPKGETLSNVLRDLTSGLTAVLPKRGDKILQPMTFAEKQTAYDDFHLPLPEVPLQKAATLEAIQTDRTNIEAIAALRAAIALDPRNGRKLEDAEQVTTAAYQDSLKLFVEAQFDRELQPTLVGAEGGQSLLGTWFEALPALGLAAGPEGQTQIGTFLASQQDEFGGWLNTSRKPSFVNPVRTQGWFAAKVFTTQQEQAKKKKKQQKGRNPIDTMWETIHRYRLETRIDAPSFATVSSLWFLQQVDGAATPPTAAVLTQTIQEIQAAQRAADEAYQAALKTFDEEQAAAAQAAADAPTDAEAGDKKKKKKKK
jgi:hypothetical protein